MVEGFVSVNDGAPSVEGVSDAIDTSGLEELSAANLLSSKSAVAPSSLGESLAVEEVVEKSLWILGSWPLSMPSVNSVDWELVLTSLLVLRS